jgi:DNA-3-methyladenine glycosylase II
MNREPSLVWSDYETFLEIQISGEFDFRQCLIFLGRSPQECLHSIAGPLFYKAVRLNGERLLLKISSDNQTIRIEYPFHTPAKITRAEIAKFGWEFFDLGRDLSGFYQMGQADPVLKSLIAKYRGLRIIGIPDLFETLTWAIIGQQINLTFAYTMKKKLVEKYGEKFSWADGELWFFPEPDAIVGLEVQDLARLQFSRQKAEYVIGLAKLFANGSLRKDKLKQQSDQEIYQKLLGIRGVGKWTADYTMMKSFYVASAFPIADVGLHQALKNVLELPQKPTIEQIQTMAVHWKGWEAYATFYLWRSLYD